MRNKIIIIYIITAIIYSNTLYAKCSNNKYLVTRVIDGDTIEVDGSYKIRVLGIDAYDKNKARINKQSIRTGYTPDKIKHLSKKAKNRAILLLLGRCVSLVKDYKDIDRYNRYLRYVEIEGKDYQRIMLDLGLANVYCNDIKIRRFEEYYALSKFKCTSSSLVRKYN
jgi:micrococcal nuclease